MKQVTIAEPIGYDGIGLHSGKPVSMRLVPAPEDTGIVFVRTDLDGASVRATVEQVTNTMRATTLECGDATVFTVEHVLSALFAMGIDNCMVEMDAAEPPVGDGSAAVFVDLIDRVGRIEQKSERKVVAVSQPCSVYDKEGDRFILALPYDGLRVTFVSENSHPLIGAMVCDIDITEDSYRASVMPARTIGFSYELEALQAMGLALGGSVENAVVYSETECLSDLRYPDELVRHKVLDVIGDIYLAGHVQAHIIARKSGHALNVELAKKIAEGMK